MSPVATFHDQLASIMEVLASTAVAEICELVDSGYAVLQLEISRSRKENEVLRRKLRLMELRATRTTALRAATFGSGLLPARGRPSVSLLGEPRTRATPTDILAVQRRLSNQNRTPWCRDSSPPLDSEQETTRRTLVAGEKTAGIKVEDEDQSWSQTEPDRSFHHAAEGQTMEPETSSSLIKQEAVGDVAEGSVSWTSGEGSSASTQHALKSSQRPETRASDSGMLELQEADPSGSSALRASENVSGHSGSSFGFSCGEVRSSASEQPVGFHEQQQGALQRGSGGILSTFILKDGCLIQQKVKKRVTKHKEEDKMFVCNFCGKTLACLKNLKTHMRVHTGEKPFTCELCDKCFSDSSNLKRHQSVHTGEKRYVCVHCGKRFAQSGSLKAHMSVHKDCKQFKCSFCGKTFTSGGHLRRHVTVHAGEKRSAVSQ